MKMQTWNYYLPIACFLLYGREHNGQVQANSRVDARAAVKRKFNMRRVPIGSVIELATPAQPVTHKESPDASKTSSSIHTTPAISYVPPGWRKVNVSNGIGAFGGGWWGATRTAHSEVASGTNRQGLHPTVLWPIRGW